MKKNLENYHNSRRYSYAVRNAVFSGLVATFDELIATLLRTVLTEKPQIIASFDKQISYQDIVKAKDFSALQADVISQALSEVMKKSRIDQLSWIEKYISNTKLSEKLSDYDKFIELTERRNVYVHHDGYPSEEYYQRIESATGRRPNSAKEERLPLSSKYIKESSDTLIEAYVLISQSVVRKFSKGMDGGQIELINDQFNHAIFSQIENGRFESAVRISKMMREREFGVSDIFLKMGIINCAIAEKKNGSNEAAMKLLSESDWSSARLEFELCKSAIKEDLSKVISLIPRLKESDLVSVESYFEWPAFDWIRDKDQFWRALEEVYGDEIQRSIETSSLNSGDDGISSSAATEVVESDGSSGQE